jgi:hypothetical protein
VNTVGYFGGLKGSSSPGIFPELTGLPKTCALAVENAVERWEEQQLQKSGGGQLG